MNPLKWLNDPKRADWPAWGILGIAIAWSVFRVARSFQILFEVSDDLYTYFAIWSLLQYREMADIAVRQSLYLPHTWFFVTPLFLFGFPAARILVLTVNIVAVAYICYRLAGLLQLEGVKRWLLPAMFMSWLSTGLVLGLGNLALVCVALTLAAYPFDSAPRGVALAFSAMKQSIAFPVYFSLLWRRPKALILPCAIFGVAGVAVMIWARLGPSDVIRMARGAMYSVSTWTQYDHTCLRRLLVFFTSNKALISLLSWGTWFLLFTIAFTQIKDPLLNLAALLLICLLPMYHNIYDLVVAVPVLGILLKRRSLIWPVALTVALATNLASHLPRFMPRSLKGFAEALDYAYYPLLILTLFGVLVWLDRRQRVAAPAAIPLATLTARQLDLGLADETAQPPPSGPQT